MNHNTLLRLNEPIGVLGARKDIRNKVAHVIAITDRGIGEIVNISRGGLSFGCIYPHTFPDSWHMDILDIMGSHIRRLRVRKIWERTIDNAKISADFELEIGVEFIDITIEQAAELEHLLKNLDLIAKQANAQWVEYLSHDCDENCKKLVY